MVTSCLKVLRDYHYCYLWLLFGPNLEVIMIMWTKLRVPNYSNKSIHISYQLCIAVLYYQNYPNTMKWPNTPYIKNHNKKDAAEEKYCFVEYLIFFEAARKKMYPILTTLRLITGVSTLGCSITFHQWIRQASSVSTLVPTICKMSKALWKTMKIFGKIK